MAIRLTWVLCLSLVTISAFGHDGHEHYEPRTDHPEDIFDKKLREDREHLKEDIEKYLKLNPQMLNNASQRELHYFYFVMHDFDKNNKLDGLEILLAVGHILQHRENEGNYDPESFSSSVDQLLKNDDLNQDGFLSYDEFITAQKKTENAEQPASQQQENQ